MQELGGRPGLGLKSHGFPGVFQLITLMFFSYDPSSATGHAAGNHGSARSTYGGNLEHGSSAPWDASRSSAIFISVYKTMQNNMNRKERFVNPFRSR